MGQKPDMQLRDFNGVKLEFYDGGNPEGDPLYYIHGGGSVEFQGIADQPMLVENYRLINVHRRGYGRSDFPDSSMTIEHYAADTKMVLDHLGIERAHFVSESAGGLTLLQFALDYPEAVQTITLMEPPIPSVINADPQFLEAMETAGARYEEGDKAGAVDFFLRGVAGDNYQEQFDANLPEGWFEQMVVDIEVITQVESAAIDNWSFTEEDARRITQPILNLTGERTASYLAKCYETVKSWFPHAENVVLADTTHGMVETNPGGVAKHLHGFVSRHPISKLQMVN